MKAIISSYIRYKEGGAAATLGGIGVLTPAAGIAVGIGAAPVVAAGAVVGLAAYGIKKAFGW
ncbi:MAG: hypothetical protein V7K72_23725 [Nostoc sp.]|uniref:hypothetical protein n=1 Tax=Nostoc sp. TaxID=1180 RepID=UPI002FF7C34A